MPNLQSGTRRFSLPRFRVRWRWAAPLLLGGVNNVGGNTPINRVATPSPIQKQAPTEAAKPMRAADRLELSGAGHLLKPGEVLEPLGQHLVRALSGDEALKKVLIHDFAVILLDVQMPGMNGFETAQLIKSRERSRLTPIIFLTAISKDEQYVFEGYSAGAVDYMSKPFNPAILRSKVAVFVDLFLKNEQIREQSEQLRESERRTLELQHQARMQESDARFAEIVDSAMEAIITFGDDRRVMHRTMVEGEAPAGPHGITSSTSS